MGNLSPSARQILFLCKSLSQLKSFKTYVSYRYLSKQQLLQINFKLFFNFRLLGGRSQSLRRERAG